MMSVNSREDIEEERRLFYVALTRAEQRAILTYAEQRYRWGKLTDGELSRFVDEIDDCYLEFSVPKEMRRSVTSVLDSSIFGDEPPARAPFRRAGGSRPYTNERLPEALHTTLKNCGLSGPPPQPRPKAVKQTLR